MRCTIVKPLLSVMFLFLCCSSFGLGGELNDVMIVRDTLQATSNCIHYKVVGLCFWQKDWYSPPKPTLKLDQYLPDMVVSVFTTPQDNPWWFANNLIDPEAYQVGQAVIKKVAHFNMGYGESHENSTQDINNRFHEVDIIGNPALLI